MIWIPYNLWSSLLDYRFNSYMVNSSYQYIKMIQNKTLFR
jgi:hypothetical protein